MVGVDCCTARSSNNCRGDRETGRAVDGVINWHSGTAAGLAAIVARERQERETGRAAVGGLAVGGLAMGDRWPATTFAGELTHSTHTHIHTH